MVEDKPDIKVISEELYNINESLEKILHAQFGIEDQEWIRAISTLEDGFGYALNWILKKKGIQLDYKILTNEDVKKILKMSKF